MINNEAYKSIYKTLNIDTKFGVCYFLVYIRPFRHFRKPKNLYFRYGGHVKREEFAWQRRGKVPQPR